MSNAASQNALHGPDRPRMFQRVEDAVDAHAARHPHATALLWRDGSLTYASLAHAAARIARVLRDLPGAGDPDEPHRPVAVRIERGPHLVAALLGVLKSKAPYLALPTDWPQERCRQAMRQAGATICLVDAADAGAARGGLPGLVAVDIDLDIDLDIDAETDTDADAQVGAGGVTDAGGRRPPAPGCAVFHTSGTTGTPKAVLSPHSGILRIAADPLLDLGAGTRMLQTAPCGWDAFSLELWAPLVNGGSCLLHQGGPLTPGDLRRAVQAGVNTAWLTASLFHAFVDEDPTCFAGLRLLMSGGERLSPRHAERCLAANPGLRLVNGYGPVESTVFVTAHEVRPSDCAGDLPVGRPVAGTSVRLLGADGTVVPPGEEGEIAVSGEGLALAYLGEPDATRAAFPELPLGEDGAPLRTYLTGDQGRIADDGVLHFLGRRDRQVKLRGVRVDPVEVERVIEALPEVRRAAVAALPLGGATKDCLAAFCTVAEDAELSADKVQAAVADVLPAACVPRYVRMLAALPVTARGKVDTAALVASLPQAGAGAEPAFAARAQGAAGDLDEVAQAVLTAAGELLGRPVAAAEDIFRAGATSVTAIRLAARLERAFGTRLSAADVMRARTPQALADRVRTRPGA